MAFEISENAQQCQAKYTFHCFQGIHKTLESRVSRFLAMEDTILYAACFDANTGLFETILGPEDAVISDELNHASIIDGVRLCKASRYRYRNNDMADLEAKLKEVATWGDPSGFRPNYQNVSTY
mgnify:CR=1 FL=1